MRRLFPHPVLTLTLLLMWLVLNRFSPGHFILGLLIAMGASWAMVRLQPPELQVKNWLPAPRLFLIVMLDIIRSNIAVSTIIIRGPNRGRVSGFVLIPLDLQNRIGLSVLACIVTSTPGTAWIEHDSTRSTVLLHVFDLVDEAEWIDTIKNRYEKLLLEIFQ